MYNNTMSDSDSESSEEHSSSECSTDSSDDDKLEMVKVNNNQVLLPQGLCEKKDIFNEFFARSWNALGESNQKHLRQFLPKFPANEEQEQNITLQRLFKGETFKFSSPLDNFYEHLRDGHYRPDIAKMRYLIRKAERKESLWRHRKFKERLQAEILESRKNLMQQMINLPPGVQPSLPGPGTISSNIAQNPKYSRTKRRYFDILASIKSKVNESGFSSDDNYPEGAPTPVSRKDKRVLNTIKNSYVLNGEKVVVSTIASKAAGFDLEKNVEPNHNPYIITENVYRQLIQEHRKRKLDSVPSESQDINISEIIMRAKVNYNKREKLLKTEVLPKPVKRKIKKEVTGRINYSSELNFSSGSESDSATTELSIPTVVPAPVISTAQLSINMLVTPSSTTQNKAPTPKAEGRKKIKTEHLSPKPVRQLLTPPLPAQVVIPPSPVVIKTEPKTPPAFIKCEDIKQEVSEYITPATLSDLEGIDMMKLPIDLHDSSMDMMEISTKVELMQDTHANYLALIRDIICSTPEHRMDMAMLQEKLRAWQENPITALNDWYCLADNWLADLQSAINFLSGNFPEQPDEFVPYIEFKPSLNKYQWIGAGRDSDNLLAPLFQYWLDHKSEMKPVISIKEKEDDKVDIDLDLDRSLTPPPPRCPTDWQVRKADVEEVKLFQEQERQRYDNPHKSFTYRCNGYESVVGPLKGVYTPSASNTKARGHTMLSADRPNFVTILSLVRDATARLPNGEGTRAEICELLKCSQYISNTAPENLLQSVVSGALDRMHTQYDPCVKYDSKRKIWIYLHRNRSEQDFERIHQQHQGMNKTTKKKKSPAKPKTPKVEKKNNNNATRNNSISLTTPVVPIEMKPQVEKALKEPPPKQTSLLINQQNQNINSHSSLHSQSISSNSTLKVHHSIEQEIKQEPQKVPECSTPTLRVTSKVEELSQEDREINQALQSITQPIQPSPTQQIQSAPHLQTTPSQVHQVLQVVQPATVQQRLAKQPNKKSVVKIITSNQGKSLIIPSSANTIIKQDGRNVIATTKVNQTPIITQHLLQSIAQQKQISQQQQQLIRVEVPDQKDNKKANLSIQQQILQSISPQQLPNIKNVTLLRNVRQNQSLMLAQNDEASTASATDGKLDGIECSHVQQPPIRVQQGTLTVSQQQQLLQTLRQKNLAQVGGQQQLLIRHKAPMVPKTVQAAPGTSLLGHARVVAGNRNSYGNATNKATLSTNQGPIVAKVLTNSAGQVISVESLLAHQKQHGGLSQGATLRVSGIKGGPNIIQLASTQSKTSQAAVAQVVGSQNNFITLTNQPKLVLSSTTNTNATTTVTASKPITKTVTKTQSLAKINQKVTQQIINAKFIAQSVGDGQKMVQPKVIIGQNQLKLANKNTKPINIQTSVTNSNSIRMVSAANLNLAHISGKPVLLASKGSSLQNMQGQNVIIQTQANTTTSSLLAASKSNTNTSGVNVISQAGQQVMLAPQLKVQQQVLLGSNVKNSNLIQNQGSSNQQIIVGGHPVRLANTSAGNAQRVVLASQGQGGQLLAQQILLPAGFQGTAINIKSLQGVKVIPIAQQAKGFQGRQVFARVMNPSSIVRSATVSAADVQQTTPTSE